MKSNDGREISKSSSLFLSAYQSGVENGRGNGEALPKEQHSGLVEVSKPADAGTNSPYASSLHGYIKRTVSTQN